MQKKTQSIENQADTKTKQMKILVISDKFKFTFTSNEINYFVTKVLRDLGYEEIISFPVSDGGDGFLDALISIRKAEKIEHKAVNAVFDEIDTYFLLENDTAYIEYAKTCGLTKLQPDKRNPLYTSSYGFGLQIKEALKYNISKIITGIGGSATNDAGIGMATALGVRFFDKYGNQILPTGKNLIKIYHIDTSDIHSDLKNIKFYCATDVDNPLFGKNGAAYVFAGQKGATKEDIKLLDKGLRHFADVVSKYSKKSLARRKGLGAAGGLPASMFAFFDAEIISGSEFIFDLFHIEEKIKEADLIITGEGKFDSQSLNGKLTGKVIQMIKKYNKKGLVICGCSDIQINDKEIDVLQIFDCGIDLKTAKQKTLKILKVKLQEYFILNYYQDD